MTPSADELRQMIDEALEEIDRVESEVEELLTDVLGPQIAARVKRLGEFHGHQVTEKLPKRAKSVTRGSSPGSSTGPPASR